jgi:hypothetical protein
LEGVDWTGSFGFKKIPKTNFVYMSRYTQTLETMDSVRWNVSVSGDTDQSLRMFIAAQGGGRKGDLSRFIEEAVRSYLLEKAVEQAKSAATGIGETELTELIEEAIDMARGQVRTGYPFHAQ